MKNKKRSVRLRFEKTNGASKGGKSLKPGPRSLFEPVERFEKPTYMSGSLGIDETRWLLAVDNLIKMSMKKCVFDIELMNRPGFRESER
jgi:hypothetical protein